MVVAGEGAVSALGLARCKRPVDALTYQAGFGETTAEVPLDHS
jgi:hypothetical protein